MTADPSLPVHRRPASKLGMGFTMLLGALVGAAVIVAPWGNGFVAAFQFVGSVVATVMFYGILRRVSRWPFWINRMAAMAMAFFVFGTVGYFTAHPKPQPTLAYMFNTAVPTGIEIHQVRCQWFDGQIYLAQFHANAAAIDTISKARAFEADRETDEFSVNWGRNFSIASIADPAWKLPPIVRSPRFLKWQNLDTSGAGRSEDASLMIDDATGEC